MVYRMKDDEKNLLLMAMECWNAGIKMLQTFGISRKML